MVGADSSERNLYLVKVLLLTFAGVLAQFLEQVQICKWLQFYCDVIHVRMHALLVWSINSARGNLPAFVMTLFLVERNASEALFTYGFVHQSWCCAVKRV